MSLLQQSHVSTFDSQSNLIASTNFVGTSLSIDLCNSSSSNSCMLSQVVGLTWIIDSGVTDHMTSNKEFLSNITPLHVPYLASQPNGYKVKVTSTCSFALNPSLILHNVLYIPSFHHNLIFVHRPIQQFKRFVLFTYDFCLLLPHGPSMKKPLYLGNLILVSTSLSGKSLPNLKFLLIYIP